MKKFYPIILIAFWFIWQGFFAPTEPTRLLHSDFLHRWLETFTVKPPDSLHDSKIFWLLSPMSWFWLMLVWALLTYWETYGDRDCRLSSYGGLVMLSLILVLPIDWMTSGSHWVGSIGIVVGLNYLLISSENTRMDRPKKILNLNIGLAFFTIIAAASIIGAAFGASISFKTDIGLLYLALKIFGIGCIVGGAAGSGLERIFLPLVGIGISMAIGGKSEDFLDPASKYFAISNGVIGAVIGAIVGSLVLGLIGGISVLTRHVMNRLSKGFILEKIVTGLTAGLAAGLVAGFAAGYEAQLAAEPNANIEAGVGASIGASVIAMLVMSIGAGSRAILCMSIVAALIAEGGIIFLRGNPWGHYFFVSAFNSILLIGVVMLAWLILGMVSVFFSAHFLPWLKARQKTTYWLCQTDYHRFQLSGLPWPVRWSGKLLMVEEPRQHEDFADYFVCRYCGKNKFLTVIRLVGIIGAIPSHTPDGELNISLYDPDSRKAISADIDRLALYPSPPGQTLDYDYAVNAVLIALSEDHHRHQSLKKIRVRIVVPYPLPENTLRMLADRFGPLEKIAANPSFTSAMEDVFQKEVAR